MLLPSPGLQLIHHPTEFLYNNSGSNSSVKSSCRSVVLKIACPCTMTPAEHILEKLECRTCWYTLHLIQCGLHYALLTPANDLAVTGWQPETVAWNTCS